MPPPRRGSVLIIVLVMIVFASVALVTFVERASNDLLVEIRAADAANLRLEAYSALETTLAVLEDFRAVGGALRSPAEGWGDPLTWAAYEPGEGRTVSVAFADESGKLPLPRAQFQDLVLLFQSWNVSQDDSERLADALLGWAQPDYVPSSFDAPRASDYERATLPFKPPGRSLRTFSELAAIDIVRELLFAEDGTPNELWHQFTAAVSLFNYRQPNVNSAPPAVLAALAQYDETQQQMLRDYLNGTGSYAFQGPRFFQRPNEVTTLLGAQAQPAGFSAEIQALRITVTVRQGQAVFRLNVVVAPPGGAQLVQPVKTEEEQTQEAGAGGAAAAPPPVPGNRASGTFPEAAPINYPFTLLEIRENDAPAPPPRADEDLL